MDISNFDVKIKRGAADLADTGLRYVGFAGLFGVGLLITAAVFLNDQAGRGLSWLQSKLIAKRTALLNSISGRKSDQEQPNEDLEVPQERETLASESEQQADLEEKEDVDAFLDNELIAQESGLRVQTVGVDFSVMGPVDTTAAGVLKLQGEILDDIDKSYPIDDQIDFDQVSSAVSPMPAATDDEKSKTCPCEDEVASYT